MKVAANLSMMFLEFPLLQRYENASKLGFKLIELPFPYTIPAKILKDEADKNGLKHVLINAPIGNVENGEKGLASNPNKIQEFYESINLAIEYATILQVKKIHIMAGLMDSEIDKEKMEKIYIKNLIFANEKLKNEGIELLIEPINSYTIPNYFLNSFDDGIRILEKINSENVKLLFDVFHIQQIHGQLTSLLKKYKNKIGKLKFYNFLEIEFKRISTQVFAN